MARTKPTRFLVASVCLLLAALVAPARAVSSEPAFARASLVGSGTASMQLETVPARVSRVVVRPGSQGAEAWALGTSSARVSGYAQGGSGQVVFLRYSPATGWVVTGPPKSAAGASINPALAAFGLTKTGEGWAVGDGGIILHRAPRSDDWIETAQSRTLTKATLTSVSITPSGAGFAAGVGPTILRLSQGRWALDQPSAEMTAQAPEIQSIAAVAVDQAWVVATGQVTGVDATSLLIYRRGVGGWTTVKTGQAIFDSPPAKAPSGELNRSTEAGVVAADARGAWIGGRIFPRSAATPDGDSTPGDSSRAFVIHYDVSTQRFTSYCPDLYSENVAGNDLTKMCDEPFPTAPFHVATISLSPDGDVFAGGLGLFRFSGRGWSREPDANGYLISISMASRSEGFVVSPGRSLGAGGLIRSSSTTIGHWTRLPNRPAAARWAQPQDQLLESVALAGDGSGRAVAVGAEGAGVLYSGSAWDSINPLLSFGLHATAWPAGSEPWAVGSRGIILHLRGNTWTLVDAPAHSSLFGLAFASAADGMAVGLGGTMLHYSGGRWSDVSTSAMTEDLYTVVATPNGYLAAGKDGAVIEGRPGRWTIRREARGLLLRAGAPQAPTLYSSVVLNGRVVIGGQDSSLIVREPSGAIANFPQPLQGTVLALGSAGGSLYASISPNDQKFRGEAPAAQRGTLMHLAPSGWRDIGLSRRVTLLRDRVDPSSFEDPIYSLAMQNDAQGWGAGGSPADLKDQAEGQFRSQPTSAVYRVALGADPSQPQSTAPLVVKTNGVSFAAFGESWCGNGLCSSAVGTGTMADEVALRIRTEINQASEQPGGPTFVAFTGNMRRVGIPEELAQFRNYLKGFRIPVFAAPGNLDRFTGFDPSTAAGSSGRQSSGSNDYWKREFASMPAPWGTGKQIPGFVPVTTGGIEPQQGLARTHYAFDVTRDGRKLMRFVFVDSSTRSFGTLQEQNPQEDQRTWLKPVLAEASDVLRIPAVIVMNQPTILPSDEQLPNWTAVNDVQDFDDSVIATRVSAVIAGGARLNAADTIRGLVPLKIVGGGGAPLGREPQTPSEVASKLPSDGYYHAWHLMHVDPTDRPIPLFAQARIDDEAFPVVESLAMHSYFGYRIEAGNTTDISALARMATGGFSDPEQAKASYLSLSRRLSACSSKAQGNGVCISRAATLPRFRFSSQNPGMADFVERDALNPRDPNKLGKAVIREAGGLSGLLCAFGKLGRVGIDAVAGLHRAHIEIEIVPGNGPCINKAVIAPKKTPSKKPVVVDPPVRVAPKQYNYFFRTLDQGTPALFPPPPAPVVAPAPPGAPGVGRKEEHEVETESETHGDGKHTFTAISYARRQAPISEAASWMILGSVISMSVFGAFGVAFLRRRKQVEWQRGRL